MNPYRIFTDTTNDLPAKLIEELEITVVPMAFTFDGKTYIEAKDETSKEFAEFYKGLRLGKDVSTSQITPNRFIQEFEPCLRDGCDILYIGFSSGLSGTLNASRVAASQLKEKYPEREIMCVDSLCASLGLGMLVYMAANRKSKGYNISEVAAYADDIKGSICHLFTVDDLNHLKKGGRISATTAFIGGMLGIKPILHVDDAGKLINIGKARGRKQAIDELIGLMEQNGTVLSGQTVFIGHSDCLKDAEYAKEEISRRFSPRNIIIGWIDPVISCHSGIGTLAIFFTGSKR